MSSAQILRGDCVERMYGMEPQSIDLIVADSPYGANYQSKRRAKDDRFSKIEGDATFDAEFHFTWLSCAYRVLKPGAHLYSFIDDVHLGDMRAAASKAGFNVKRTIVWDKGHWGSGDLKGDYGHSTEFIVFCHKGRRELNGGRETNVLRYARVPPKQLRHPTEKPADLLRYLITRSSAPGETVLDPFLGSGATGGAAMLEGRDFVGIEIDEQYIPVAVDWIKTAKETTHAPH